MNWLIWSNEHEGWWSPAELGYTDLRNLAGRYTFERAKQICQRANVNLSLNKPPNETMCPDWEQIEN